MASTRRRLSKWALHRATSRSRLDNSRASNLLLWVILLFSLTAISAFPAAINGLRIEGQASLEAYTWSGEVRPRANVTEHFAVDVDRRGNWSIESHNSIQQRGFEVTSYDGSAIYTVFFNHSVRKSRDSEEWTDAVPLEKGMHSATVSPNGFPIDSLQLTRFVHLALLSGLFIEERIDARVPVPWYDARRSISAYAFKASWKRAEEWPYIPQEIRFIVDPLGVPKDPDGLLVPSDRASYQARLEEEREFRYWSQNATAANFTVQEDMSVAGIKLPRVCSLEVLWIGVGAAPAASLLASNRPASPVAMVFRARVTNAIPIGMVEGRPQPVGTLSVDDYRFRKVTSKIALQSLRYQIADNKWKTQDDGELQSSFALLSGRGVSPRYDGQFDVWLKRSAVSVLIVLAVAPVALFGWNRRGRARGRDSQT